MDRRGIGGFMEAMFSMMVVIITLTAFLGILAYAGMPEQDDGIDISFLDGLYVSGDSICGLDECSLFLLLEREGAEGLDIRVGVIGELSDGSLEFCCGERTDRPTERSGVLTLDSDDGRKLPVRYEVILWT